MKQEKLANSTPVSSSSSSTFQFAVILLMFFCSGAAALIYEVLWMKELGLLFGNTTHATATTLTAFFAGLAAGGYVWGQRAPKLKNPLVTYGVLELAVAVSVAAYFIILPTYRQFYPQLFQWFGTAPGPFIAVKFALSMIILFPAAFFLGGTLPVISQFLVRRMHLLGRKISVVYAVNTVGAAVGALVAGFYLPMALGFRKSYFLAMALTAGIGLLAFWLGRRGFAIPENTTSQETGESKALTTQLGLPSLRGLAFLSGLVTIALQVLWTRMFSQVLQNSIYTFSLILVLFLICLAIGAGLGSALMRIRIIPTKILYGMFLGSALMVAASPFIFNYLTEGLHYFEGGSDWASYIFGSAGIASLVMGPSLICLGGVFPLLLKLAEPYDSSAGRLVGQLTALNTLGAIAGSISAGFFLLDVLGLWASIRLMGMSYMLATLYLLFKERIYDWKLATLPGLGILLLVSLLDISRLPLVWVEPLKAQESIYEIWEESAATVAVVKQQDSLKIRVNNHYTLGSTGVRDMEAFQSVLPILIHPNPRSIYALGLGTGITAGASLNFPIEHLVVTELVPKVITASKKYFHDYTNGLFTDPRAQVLAEDGRNYLAGTQQKFDVIIGDLFIPWKAGTGSLYSLEHFQKVHDRLNEDGIFMQWMPAFQISRDEFYIVVRTLQEVFPQVTLWRGDFLGDRASIGLLAQTSKTPLAANAALLTAQEDLPSDQQLVPLLAHYAGNMLAVKQMIANLPINHDDHPIMEYRAPITQRLQKTGQLSWLAGEHLMDLMDLLQKRLPASKDPYLNHLPVDQLRNPAAGLHLHHAMLHRENNQSDKYNMELQHYEAILGRTRK